MDLDRQVKADPAAKNPAGAGRRRRTAWGLPVTAGLLVLLVGLAFIFRARLLTAAAEYLVVDDSPRPAEILFLLNGDYNTRPFQAARLYQQGLAPRIVIARVEGQPADVLGLVQNETSISVAVMEKLGVPADKILILEVPGGVTSTYDEAVVLRDYVRQNSIHSVLLVTSAFHTRRARWIVTRELAGLPVTLEVSAVPYGGFDATNWWRSENGLIALNNEYIKLFYYFWKYR
jgi:uncharacterized SAM-binding protein YcdF (DUF218 family)